MPRLRCNCRSGLPYISPTPPSNGRVCAHNGSRSLARVVTEDSQYLTRLPILIPILILIPRTKATNHVTSSSARAARFGTRSVHRFQLPAFAEPPHRLHVGGRTGVLLRKRQILHGDGPKRTPVSRGRLDDGTTAIHRQARREHRLAPARKARRATSRPSRRRRAKPAPTARRRARSCASPMTW